ncbi:MAG: hypothetical protein CVV44_20290 [Spirochaetae bacterium HGW-Spirochaetae-1]|jgi:uncharacterized Fe-S cluster-containing radical SAM superfamily enzyme|nr:MAG: hypothetical protein CVV44_20290 [Spirochaetae bacterium HGW-Spirochaetae-1]
MKIKDIRKLEEGLAQLEQDLIDRIIEIGTGEAKILTGEKQPSLSQFIKGTRKYSYEKIIELAKIIFED